MQHTYGFHYFEHVLTGMVEECIYACQNAAGWPAINNA